MTQRATLTVPPPDKGTDILAYAVRLIRFRDESTAMMKRELIPAEVEVIGEFDGISIKCDEKSIGTSLVAFYRRCARARSDRLANERDTGRSSSWATAR